MIWFLILLVVVLAFLLLRCHNSKPKPSPTEEQDAQTAAEIRSHFEAIKALQASSKLSLYVQGRFDGLFINEYAKITVKRSQSSKVY